MDFLTAHLSEWRDIYGTATLVVAGAFLVGLAFGALAEASAFCLRQAVIETAEPRRASARPFKAAQFAAAMFVAVALTQALALSGFVDLSGSIYHSSPLNLAGVIVGGLLFGAGMILAGGCVGRILVLAASGNLRSWFTLLVTAVAAYAAMRGVLAAPRSMIADVTPVLEGAQTISGLLGVSPASAALFALVPVAAALIWFARDTGWRAVAIGSGVGVLVAAAWVVTGVIGFDDFEPTPLAAITFTAPVAESLQYLMISTGDTLRFSIALVLGVLGGAFLSSLAGGRLRLQGFQSEDAPLRYAIGGLLMGFGGVLATGCSIGQGLSGVSTLSTGSFVALVAIIAGARIMLRLRKDGRLPVWTIDNRPVPEAAE